METKDSQLRIRTTIPAVAVTVSRILREAGYSKKRPYEPKCQTMLTQMVDLPGALDLLEGWVVSIWPEKKTVAVILTNGKDTLKETIRNTVETYPQGECIEAWWRTEGLRQIQDELYQEHTGATLSVEVAKTVPVGTLTLPRGTQVRFLDTHGSPETFHLVSVSNEKGRAVITYRNATERYTDFVRDLAPEDIHEVLRAIGHPKS
jgi:hypothetical protein